MILKLKSTFLVAEEGLRVPCPGFGMQSVTSGRNLAKGDGGRRSLLVSNLAVGVGAKKSQKEPKRAKMSQNEPNRGSQKEPKRAKKNQKEPKITKMNQKEPKRAKLSQNEPNRAGRVTEGDGGEGQSRGATVTRWANSWARHPEALAWGTVSTRKGVCRPAWGLGRGGTKALSLQGRGCVWGGLTVLTLDVGMKRWSIRVRFAEDPPSLRSRRRKIVTESQSQGWMGCRRRSDRPRRVSSVPPVWESGAWPFREHGY